MNEARPYPQSTVGPKVRLNLLLVSSPIYYHILCLNICKRNNINICCPKKHGKYYLISREGPHIHYTITLTSSHVAQKKLAYNVNGNEVKVFAPID